nr:immunoglobulin light chain junction region [Macaca mulatta]MOW58695.1 immunoglobulin light chain junction region [Macaca mulatta]MOW59825.1 immunoglobulin light chain junction region [Macaca mulatta]MOW60051.1 immunoglobulin light chain junction region [Macaca mulatta]
DYYCAMYHSSAYIF